MLRDIKSDKFKSKRREILSAGLDILYDAGYNGTSVKDIVDAANVPKGSFYFYFKSKQDFALQAMQHYLQEANADLDEILADEKKSIKRRLIKFYQHRIDHVIDNLECRRGCLINNMASEMASTNEALRSAIHEMLNETIKTVAKMIKQGQKDGSLKVKLPAAKLASTLEDAWKGALVTMKACQCAEPLHNFKNVILKTLLY